MSILIVLVLIAAAFFAGKYGVSGLLAKVHTLGQSALQEAASIFHRTTPTAPETGGGPAVAAPPVPAAFMVAPGPPTPAVPKPAAK